MNRIVLWSTLCLAACAARDALPPGPDGGPVADGGAAPAPILTGIDPAAGPVEGGTVVTLRGEHFAAGALVVIGGKFADDVAVISASEVTARTPAADAPGAADVGLINPDGQSSVLRAAFTYEAPPPLTIGWCALVSPASATVPPGAAVLVRGRVFVDGVTPGSGRGERVRAQVGYGFPGGDPSQWTWLPAFYERDVDGLAAGDLANDEYAGSFSVPLAGEYRVAFRVSGDNGQTWSYCDLDGLDNGFSEAQAGVLRVRPRTIGFCNLQHPSFATAQPGRPTGPFFGRVFVEGVTDAAGPGAGVRAQVGFGPAGEPPTADGWTWSDAAYHADVPGLDPQVLANDEYAGTLTVAATGTYDVAYRFSLDAGATWTYCDLDGSTNGYASAQAGVLVVAPPAVGPDWCRFEGPSPVDVVLGEATPVLRGRVFVEGVTSGAGKGAGVRGQVGFGPLTAAVTGSAWSWSEAAYVGDADGLAPGDLANDEYGASLSPALPGTYAVAYRFSIDEGQSWTYCDLDGLDNGFDLASQTGRMRVTGLSVGYCQVHRPASTQIYAGQAPPTFFGRVFVQGRTPGAGRGANVTAQVGYGLESADPATWTWAAAAYSGDVDGLTPGDLANDEYAGTFAVPTPGAYRVAYRFSIDGGQTWTLCDLGGSGDGFAAADAAALTVLARAITDARIQAPSPIYAVAGLPVELVFAQVKVPGFTPGPGPASGVVAEIGFGPAGSDPRTSGAWMWQAATYNPFGPTGEYDEVQTLFTVAPAAGTYHLAARFRLEEEAVWIVGDLDGSATGGYDVAQAKVLEVSGPANLGIGWCATQFPDSVAVTVGPSGGASETIYGQVWIDGRTNQTGWGSGIAGQIGWGVEGSDPATWTWVPTGYRRDVGNNDEYEGFLVLPPGTQGSNLRYAYRYTTDGGGTWVYCSLESAGGSNATTFTPGVIVLR